MRVLTRRLHHVRPHLLRSALLLVALAPGAGAGAEGVSRPPLRPSASDIQVAIRKLSMLGSVLYVAAHPDDENTALLTYFSQGRGARTGYLSITRGSGGQNLIGSEIGEALGVIRTQELLEARRVDGAEQFFTTAIDFGYSKSPEETIGKWGHDRVLGDVVWIVRSFRPDVIITRFPTEARTHGHHTASARLALEAFDAAADRSRFADQLAHVQPWRARRVLWNVFRPQGGASPAPAEGEISVDVGAFDPLLGKSYTEIAGESRSMHKSQGFGAPERRGSQLQQLQRLAGDAPTKDAFDGVDVGWSRVPGGEAVGRLLAEAERAFDPRDPARVVPILVRARKAMDALGDDPLVELKREEIAEVIRGCAGLWVEALADRAGVSPGDTLRVTLTALRRSEAALTLERIDLPAGWGSAASLAGGDLPVNRAVTRDVLLKAPPEAPFTAPHGKEGSEAPAGAWPPLGRAETAPVWEATFVVRAGDATLDLSVPLLHRWVDRVHGERYRRVQIVPPATARFEEAVRVFPDASARELRVVVRAQRDSVAGRVRLETRSGWRITPADLPFSLRRTGEETTLRFQATPPAGAGASDVVAEVESRGRTYSANLIRIDYPHIPALDMYPRADMRVVRLDLKRVGENVGYVMGSGDAVPEALREVGYRVTLLSDDDVAAGALDAFDAIVIGVRAYNTRPRLVALQPRLLDYVERGGTLVVQYNTSDPALDGRLGPYPFSIGRDRVAVEEAPVTMLDQGHPLLSRPNRITPADFDGWVQERGLYFAGPWDARYQAVLASSDPEEKPLEGGLLYARHGKGVFVYTGYSFFRELPAGVPGAYRLFVNLVSARP
jgi:LmbE family N-acetylglucosaminyl deacetylase